MSVWRTTVNEREKTCQKFDDGVLNQISRTRNPQRGRECAMLSHSHFMYIGGGSSWYLSSDIIYSSEIYVRATFYCTMIYFLWSVVSLSQDSSWCCPPPAVGISTKAPRRPY